MNDNYNDKIVHFSTFPLAGDTVAKIGDGTFAKVYKTERGVALKRFKDRGFSTTKVRELIIQRKLNGHPHIIKVLGIQLTPSANVVMDLAENTLATFNWRGGVTSNVHNRIFSEILLGLDYMHTNNIWHLDLKPANILFVDGVCKIADFSLSRYVPYESDSGCVDITSAYWRAPELYLGDVKYTEKVDIWSFGVMFTEALIEMVKKPDDESSMTGLFTNLMSIWDVMWVPTDAEWPGVTTLPKWRGQYVGITPNSDTMITFQDDQRHIILTTLTWPLQRASTTELLKCEYFMGATVSVDEIVRPHWCESSDTILSSWLTQTERQELYDWLWEKVGHVQPLYIYQFAIKLFNSYVNHYYVDRDKLKPYLLAAWFIGIAVYDDEYYSLTDLLDFYSATIMPVYERAVERLLNYTDLILL